MNYHSKHLDYYNSDERVHAYIEKDARWADFTRNILIDLLNDLPKSGRVLDVGCGYGRDVSTLRELGYDATGIDESSAMVKAARKMYGEYFQQLSLQKLPNLTQQFNIVYCRNVLVHVTESALKPALFNLYNIVQPGGTIILISKEGKGVSITHTTGAERETILHSKEDIKEIFSALGASFMEPPHTLPAPSANGDRLFCMRIQKPETQIND